MTNGRSEELAAGRIVLVACAASIAIKLIAFALLRSAPAFYYGAW